MLLVSSHRARVFSDCEMYSTLDYIHEQCRSAHLTISPCCQYNDFAQAVVYFQLAAEWALIQ